MKGAIIRRILMVTAAALLLFMVSAVLVVSALNKEEAKDNALSVLSIIEREVKDRSLQSDGEFKDLARSKTEAGGIRVTVIALDGRVIADSNTGAPEELENHGGRPEVKKALEGGTGTDIRRSESFNIKYLYAAKAVEAAGDTVILRVAVPVTKINTYLWTMVVIMAAIILAVLGVTFFFSRSVTGMVLRPIAMIKAKLDTVGKPEDAEITLTPYDELNQVLIEIDEISERLNANITDGRKLQREKHEFFMNASHELNTPLSAVLGYAELLKNEKKYNPEFVDAIYKQSERMKALIGNMLKIGEMEEGKETKDERINLSGVAEEVIAAFKPKADKKNIALKGRLEDAHVFADREKLTEVVSNLIDNSVKYTEDGGRVDVILKARDGKAVLTVKDNGIGIAQKHLSRICERFYRTDKGRSRAEGGTGLGLAIVKHICNHYNAPLTIKSVEGEGTEITVSFKLF